MTSKHEIRKLVLSNEYQASVRVKGTDPKAWNWQVNERSNGFIPNDTDKLVDDDKFELEKELLNADEDLSKEKAIYTSS